MKIVHFGKFYPPEYGGIESVTQALAEDHAAAGHNVQVVCFTQGASQLEEVGRLKIRRCKAKANIASQPLSVSYLWACADAAQNADLVHVHAPNLLAALAVLRLPRRVKAVIHWHADIENKGVIGRLVRPIERAMLRRADKIVATTGDYARASSALRAFIDRVEVIPIGIADIENTTKVEVAERPYVLFVGRLVPYKGLSVLIDAAAMVEQNVEFRIVGVGPQLTELKSQAQRLGITDKVKFVGRVGEDQLQDLLHRSAVFCFPSINRLEAFGVVLLEAMRAGRAIISTSIHGSGVPWVNSDGINVPVSDPKALAEAISRLLSNPDEAARLGKLARARFKKEFSRNLMSDRFLCLYNRLDERSGN